jgi:MATE family multidrug resistance protein
MPLISLLGIAAKIAGLKALWQATDSLRAALRSAAAPVVPLYLSWLLMALIGVVDLSLASRINTHAQAALGIADQILFFNMLAMSGLAGGLNSCLSQALGAGNLPLARAYKQAGLMITIVIGSTATLAGFCLAKPLAELFCADQAVVNHASQYIAICSLANLPWAMIQFQGAIFRSLGCPQVVAYQWLLITVIAIIPGSIAFFYLPGCHSLVPIAIAWVIAAIAGSSFGHTLVSDALADTPASVIRLDQLIDRIRDILKVAIPILVSEMSWLLSNLLLFCLLAKLPDGATAQAAWTIKLKVEETVAYAPLLAMGMATSTMVGHKVGALRPAAAMTLTKALTIVSTVAMFIAGCLTALIAPYIIPSLTNDAAAGQLSQMLLASAVFTYPLMAISNLLSSAFEGTGKTLKPMLINFAGFFALRLPLAWLFMAPVGAGLVGVLAAKAISCAFTALAMVSIFEGTPWTSITAKAD